MMIDPSLRIFLADMYEEVAWLMHEESLKTILNEEVETMTTQSVASAFTAFGADVTRKVSNDGLNISFENGQHLTQVFFVADDKGSCLVPKDHVTKKVVARMLDARPCTAA